MVSDDSTCAGFCGGLFWGAGGVRERRWSSRLLVGVGVAVEPPPLFARAPSASVPPFASPHLERDRLAREGLDEDLHGWLVSKTQRAATCVDWAMAFATVCV
jgi:hypothetical protein